MDVRGPIGVAVDERTGHVFVTDGAGLIGHTVTMLDLHLRRVLRIIPVGPGPIAVAVDRRAARAFVCNVGYPGGPSVSVLDTAHGHRERTVPVGSNPTALAVDEATGHVFVVNEGIVEKGSAPLGSVSILTITR